MTVWFAVAGSDQGLAEARAAYDEVLDEPRALLEDKIDARRRSTGVLR